jgi:hypothetical protein
MVDTSLERSDSVDASYEYQQWKRERFLRKKLDPIIDQMIISRGRGALWDVVDVIMKYLWKYKRDYMNALMEDVKRDRDSSLNALAASKDKTVRKLGSMPEELEILISRAYLDEIQVRGKEFRHEFFRRYPAFKIATRI